MSWFIKTTSLNTSYFPRHGFFSVSYALKEGFWTFEQPNKKEIDVTHTRPVNDFKMKINIPDDEIYVGIVAGSLIRGAKTNKEINAVPKINGKPVEGWNDLKKDANNRQLKKLAINKKDISVNLAGILYATLEEPQIEYHAFFSPLHASEYGFTTVRKVNGKEVHITDMIYIDKNEFKYLPLDAIYVGVVTSEIVKTQDQNKKEGVIPIVNGKPFDKWNKKSQNKQERLNKFNYITAQRYFDPDESREDDIPEQDLPVITPDNIEDYIEPDETEEQELIPPVAPSIPQEETTFLDEVPQSLEDDFSIISRAIDINQCLKFEYINRFGKYKGIYIVEPYGTFIAQGTGNELMVTYSRTSGGIRAFIINNIIPGTLSIMPGKFYHFVKDKFVFRPK